MNSSSQIHYVVVQGKTMLIPLRYVYPECRTLLDRHEQLEQLHCLREDGCPANRSCMEKLVRRLSFLFEYEPTVELIILYFRQRNGKRLCAGVFDKEFSEPRYTTVNPWGLKRVLSDGEQKSLLPGTDYWLVSGGGDLVSPESLYERG